MKFWGMDKVEWNHVGAQDLAPLVRKAAQDLAQVRFLALAMFLWMPMAAFAQVNVGGLLDLEARVSGSDSKPYINGSPTAKPSLYVPNVRLFVDAPISENWAVFAMIQSDHYGSNTLNAPIFSLLQAQWMPFTDSDLTVNIGRILIPVGLISERYLSSENPLRHLPMNMEWTQRVDKKAGLLVGPRNYAVSPGLAFIYNRMYTQGVSVQGALNTVAEYHVAVALSAPSAFNESGEYDVPALMGRVVVKPAVWMRLGASFGHGAYMRKDAMNAPLGDADRESLKQTLFGVDATVDYRYLRVSYEYLDTRWDVARITLPGLFTTEDYLANSHMVELKADAPFHPGAYAALRYDRITVDSPVFATSPLQRLEIGIGKKFSRSVVGKLTFSRGWNEVNDLQDNVLGAQLSLGF